MFGTRSRVTLFAAFATAFVAIAFNGAGRAQSSFTPSFGTPPAGEVPILYNDHHIYAKPDELKQGRVLVALVRGTTILVPLRTMFQQMDGAVSVSYDATSKTIDVSRPGADVKVTVGQPEVTINGESRPLDVPPEIYRGNMVVPLRVISEAVGAYVQWVPDRHLVIVRYIPGEPPPTPVPVATSAPTSTPTATPGPTVAPYSGR